MVAREDAGPERFGRAVKNMAALFYVYDGLIISLRPSRLQDTLDVLTVLFDRVGLGNNVYKMAGIVFQPGRTAVIQSEEAYT